MNKIAIIGPYRYHNFGDDLIGAVIAYHLKRIGFSPVIPGLSKENCDWLGIEYSDSTISALLKSQNILIGGGGILGDSGIRPDNCYLKKAFCASIYGILSKKKVIISGVGAGPLAKLSSRLLTKAICQMTSKIGVRDNESYLFLKTLGIPDNKIIEGADLALVWRDIFDPVAGSKSKNIGVQLDIDPYMDKINKSNGIEVREILRRFISAENNVILITNGKWPSRLDDENNIKMPQLNYEYLPDFLGKLSSVRAILTSHLHLAIAAYASRIPCFSIYVREKTERFYRQIGHPERAVSLLGADRNKVQTILNELKTAVWTDYDEKTLDSLKKSANKLLDFKNYFL